VANSKSMKDINIMQRSVYVVCDVEVVVIWYKLLKCCICSREDSTEKRLQRALLNDEIDAKFGFERSKDPAKLVGWLINMHPVSVALLAS